MSGVFYDAAAGSGKTTYLARLAVEHRNGHVLLTTFTDANSDELNRVLLNEVGSIPDTIDVMPWYTFLLNECIRPFQGAFGALANEPIAGIDLVSTASALRTRKTELRHYACRHNGDNKIKIFSDKLAELALYINEITNGDVIDRLSRLYTMICIDEIQDMSGYDLDLIANMLCDISDMRFAGDQRQATFHTANVNMNKSYRKSGFGQYIKDKHLNCTVDIETLRFCHRCPQDIVDLADTLYPEFPSTISTRDTLEDSIKSPIRLVRESDASNYSNRYSAVSLVYDRRTKTPPGIQANNMGAVKGLSFDNVLLFPTANMRNWLFDHSARLSEATRAKLYVAITRARSSLAIVVSDDFQSQALDAWQIWKPGDLNMEKN